jgi:type IV pilus assembly protein PilY1
MATADVFIDPVHGPTPDPTERVWRTVLVGSLRQGGSGYYALDVTQPDDIVTAAGPTQGEIVGGKDTSPGCLNGGGGSCTAGAASSRPYPSILWEFTDTGAFCSDACTGTSAPSALGESWSRPVVGRIRVVADPNPPFVFEDRYVAMFGGGFDPGFTAGDDVAAKLPKGRAFYIVDVETGDILYKTTQGVAGGSSSVNFAPMPAAPSVVDYNDDGYLDTLYQGDVNGNMWRIDLTPDPTSGVDRGIFDSADRQVHGYKPFLLFDGCGAPSGVCPNSQPIFYDPAIIFIGGTVAPPALGISWGTGNRADLARPNTQSAGFYYVIDSGQTATTLSRTGAGAAALRNITPGVGQGPCPIPFNPSTCVNANGAPSPGFILDFQTTNEKTTSTVYATLGFLSVVTFTPDSVSPCATNGSSFRYRFFFLTGTGAYGQTGTYADFRLDLGEGIATASQSTSPQGDIIDLVMMSGGPGGGPRPEYDVTRGTQSTRGQNWKEQQ